MGGEEAVRSEKEIASYPASSTIEMVYPIMQIDDIDQDCSGSQGGLAAANILQVVNFKK